MRFDAMRRAVLRASTAMLAGLCVSTSVLAIDVLRVSAIWPMNSIFRNTSYPA